MKYYNLLFLLILFIFGCLHNSKQSTFSKKTTIEWFVPEKEVTVLSDTAVSIGNSIFHLTIKYYAVPNNTSIISSESRDTIYIEKNRNYAADLNIKKDNVNLFKKTFTKENFNAQVGTDSLYHYIMTAFEFEGIKNDKFYYKSSVCLNNSDDLITTSVIIDTLGTLTLQAAMNDDSE